MLVDARIAEGDTSLVNMEGLVLGEIEHRTHDALVATARVDGDAVIGDATSLDSRAAHDRLRIRRRAVIDDATR